MDDIAAAIEAKQAQVRKLQEEIAGLQKLAQLQDGLQEEIAHFDGIAKLARLQAGFWEEITKPHPEHPAS